MREKSTHWFYRFPQTPLYAMDFRSKKPATKQEAKRIIKQIWKIKRLPKGFEIWR